jgi:MYXO-CTERM domain-containing protein
MNASGGNATGGSAPAGAESGSPSAVLDAGGCSCEFAGEKGSSARAFSLALLALLALRRRRTRGRLA